MNDVLLKRCNFQIQICNSEVKMQSFIVCTKLMIKNSTDKNDKQCKMPIFFLYFQYIKTENAWTEK